MNGTITTIQRMSIHDGPGIRSAVFMKGCNLRCRWCHNPETWLITEQLQHIESKCIRCLSCAAVCRYKAVHMPGGKVMIDRNSCIVCGECTISCPSGAISIVGRKISAKEAFTEVAGDMIFFETSSGGVTVSGGEPFLQSEFVLEFLRLCKNAGIHTAVETNMTIKWEITGTALPYTDLWMCDIKMLNPQKHRYWTGADNSTVIDNIMKLSETDARIIVRTPVIPGVNDNEKDIRDICSFLENLRRPVHYELLPFHTFGFGKYYSLGMKNEMKDTEPLDKDIFESLKRIPLEYNI